MKNNEIKTGLKAPSTHRNSDAIQLFISALIPFLGLNENWKKYFKFDWSSDYISLKERDEYKSVVFKRFRIFKEAVITQELKDRLQRCIADKDKCEADKNEKHSRYEYFCKLLAPLFDKYNSDVFYISYTLDEVIEVSLKNSSSFIASAKIYHSGKIQPPKFSIGYERYSMSFDYVQNWIASNKQRNDDILLAAKNLIAQLPAEFFTNENDK